MQKFAKIFFVLLQIIGTILAIALLLSILACYVSPVKYWFLQFFGLFFPLIFIFNIIALALFIYFKSKFTYISLIALIISLFYVGRFFQFSSSGATNEETIKVITYNVHGFQNVSDGRVTYNEICDFLLAEDADIVCLQEYFTRGITNEIQKKLRQTYKYMWGDYDDVILSKYPFINKQKINAAGKKIIFSDINIDDKIIRVYSCHLQSTNFNPDDTQRRLTSNNSNYKRELKRVIVNLRNGFRNRAKQIDFIAQQISQSPYPTIVCGDFNDTPMSYTYQKMRKIMNDTFIEAGGGIPNTYRKLMSILRIDFIFTDKNIATKEYRVEKKIKYSDHYPVVVKLKINDEKRN